MMIRRRTDVLWRSTYERVNGKREREKETEEDRNNREGRRRKGRR